jgi:hypothetical protein
MAQDKALDEHKVIVKKPVEGRPGEMHDSGGEMSTPFTVLQQTVGNQAVQRLLAPRSGEGSFDLDDDTAARIHRERASGQPLEGGVQAQVGEAVGADFGGVRVHTSAESDALNRDLGAKAFTTGHDIFFREGAYQPYTSGGQELLAHELTHVVQQGSGAVSGPGSRMRVNAPGDAFEQQADAVAHTLTGPSGAAAGVQRQAEEEEEEVQTKREDAVQRQAAPEEEEVQMQAAEEEEEEVQTQPEEEEEETVQTQELEEEEEVST